MLKRCVLLFFLLVMLAGCHSFEPERLGGPYHDDFQGTDEERTERIKTHGGVI